jgi:hypothetical protein
MFFLLVTSVLWGQIGKIESPLHKSQNTKQNKQITSLNPQKKQNAENSHPTHRRNEAENGDVA